MELSLSTEQLRTIQNIGKLKIPTNKIADILNLTGGAKTFFNENFNGSEAEEAYKNGFALYEYTKLVAIHNTAKKSGLEKDFDYLEQEINKLHNERRTQK